MSGLRRLFRGSGRALAFVFAASVAWLLLDMAALRLSLGEPGGRLREDAPGPGPGDAAVGTKPPSSAQPLTSEGGAQPGSPAAPRPAAGPAGSSTKRREERGERRLADGDGTHAAHAITDGTHAAHAITDGTHAAHAITGVGDGDGTHAAHAITDGTHAAHAITNSAHAAHALTGVGDGDGTHAAHALTNGAHAAHAITGVGDGDGTHAAHTITDGAHAAHALTGVGDGDGTHAAHALTDGAHAAHTVTGVGDGDSTHAAHTVTGVGDGDGDHTAHALTNGTHAAHALTGVGNGDGAHAAHAITGVGDGDGTHLAHTLTDSAHAAHALTGVGDGDGAHVTGAVALGGRGWGLGATRGAAPGPRAAGTDRREQAGRSPPGTHRVFSMDATLAPRDPQAPGQFGHPVAVPDDKEEEARSRWKEGNFNVYLSDLIPVDRAVADTRPAGCSEQRVHDDLPTTTVIMCFVDEVWSTLLRSVHSVLSRSPPHLIEEVILVDDFSTKGYLKEKLDKYMSRFPKVKILHLKERHGLIRARLAGAEMARGAVLTFLDSHVECNVGWLEPLLERVRLHRAKVACPVIEVISDKDMSYMTVDNFQRGIFTWPMNFGWRQIPQEVIEKNKIKETDIIRCPVMAGGLFSIDKKYFFELGTYDPGLDVWGGENMELSFKVWMCGGEIEIVPCSRVGHIFRNDNPYSFPKDRVRTVERNLARVAEVWLDEYKELFYGHAYHLVLKNLDVGDLTQQIQLRKKLQCKSFRWYLENVYPDLEAPLVKASGLLVNVATATCVTVENTTLALEACDVTKENQKFNYTWLRRIQHGELCVAPAGAAGVLGLRRCPGGSRGLAWLHRSLATFQPEMTDHLVSEHLQQPACLEADPAPQALRVNACDSANPRQKWQFGHYYAD
ncbi:polypeptide N-acetylgalactosaminyltransferase 5 [Opisthocomus hoazin]|uniref:polypeptide N-acetylgalactosaminyltransferase 5 n=1 Tax=Opisthocomus hoazin TaxID=30419 RepID=UPI003F530124